MLPRAATASPREPDASAAPQCATVEALLATVRADSGAWAHPALCCRVVLGAVLSRHTLFACAAGFLSVALVFAGSLDGRQLGGCAIAACCPLCFAIYLTMAMGAAWLGRSGAAGAHLRRGSAD